jgi:hemolysin activation/secretion protein
VRKVIATGRWRVQHRQSWIDDTPLPVQQHRGQAFEGALTVQERFGQGLFESTLTARWRTPRPISTDSSAPLLRGEGQLTYPLILMSRPGQYRIEGQGQRIPVAVLPEDQWMLGSRHSIRGFNERMLLAGDRGYRLRQEWSTPLAGTYTGFIAHDWGQVGRRDASASRQMWQTLSGVALGIRGPLGAQSSRVAASYEVQLAWGLIHPASMKAEHPTLQARIQTQF